MNNIDILLVSSCGGHLRELLDLYESFKHLNHKFCLNDNIKLNNQMNNKTIFITHAERNIKQFINFFEAYKILKQYKPKIILSTGASPIVPFSILSILIFKSKIIYIETLTSVTKPSLTGKIMYYLADNFYYRWIFLKKYFPKGLLVERF